MLTRRSRVRCLRGNPFPENSTFLNIPWEQPRRPCYEKGWIAVWVVRGFNAVPTVGAQVKEGIEVLLAILSAMGRTPVPLNIMIKIELSVALVDKDGAILFYNRINSDKIEADSQGYLEQIAVTEEFRKSDSPVGPTYGELDLRNSPVARRYLRALLSNFLSGKVP